MPPLAGDGPPAGQPVANGPLSPTFFATAAAFRAWLEEHHDTAQELWVGFYRKGLGRPSLTWHWLPS